MLLRSILTIILICSLASEILLAQSPPLEAGQRFLENRDYVSAIRELEQAIHPDQLIHPREEAHACWLLVEANLQLASSAPADLATQPLLEAHYYLGKYERHPFRDEITSFEQLNSQTQLLVEALIEEGKRLMDNKQFASARNHLTSAQMLAGTSPELSSLFTRLQLLQGNTTTLLQAVQHHPEPTSEEEFLIAGKLFEDQNMLDSALRIYEIGQGAAGPSLLLFQRELGLYQQLPIFPEKAHTRFRKAIAAFPEALDFQLAYAAILYDQDHQTEALAYYQSVYKLDPDNYHANYGLGAHYIARASAYQERRRGEINDPEATHLIPELTGMLQQAYPHMLKLHEQAPNEARWIEQLITITTFLGWQEDQQMYEEKLRGL